MGKQSLSRKILIGGLVVALGYAGWYAFQMRGSPQAVSGECGPAAAMVDRLKPLARGELAALALKAAPAPPPRIDFNAPEGAGRTLADFKGRTVLVNLWATWCVPCREEMPALDKVQAELGGPSFEVVAINVDTRNPEKPKTWLQENGIRNLAYYADPTGKLLQILQKSGHAVGLPTTLLVDGAGCEIALLKGPAQWASPEAFAFLRTAIAKF